MGEVYRARDARLGRELALKVLPMALATDAERLKRFEKEARSASALNHPNLVTIHDIGSSNGIEFIAMELVEGRTLREILADGALPSRMLFGVAAQAADGLAKAHGAGIVHRDLKPENLMVSKDGFVKILDFGLAKLTQPEDTSDRTAAPTVSGATEPGVVMGTAGYMSPEQALGRAVDFRSDQFSLGSILYEMATGKRAFERGSAPETLTAIIRDEPEPIGRLAPLSPAPFSWIVERCLAKSADDRYASTRDLARDLANLRDRAGETSSGAAAARAEAPRRREKVWLPWAVAAALAVLAGGLWVAGRRPVAAAPSPVVRFSVLLPEGVQFENGDIEGQHAISPDGRKLVFVGGALGRRRLYLRSLDSLETRPLEGHRRRDLPLLVARLALARILRGRQAPAAGFRRVLPGRSARRPPSRRFRAGAPPVRSSSLRSDRRTRASSSSTRPAGSRDAWSTRTVRKPTESGRPFCRTASDSSISHATSDEGSSVAPEGRLRRIPRIDRDLGCDLVPGRVREARLSRLWQPGRAARTAFRCRHIAPLRPGRDAGRAHLSTSTGPRRPASPHPRRGSSRTRSSPFRAGWPGSTARAGKSRRSAWMELSGPRAFLPTAVPSRPTSGTRSSAPTTSGSTIWRGGCRCVSRSAWTTSRRRYGPRTEPGSSFAAISSGRRTSGRSRPLPRAANPSCSGGMEFSTPTTSLRTGGSWSSRSGAARPTAICGSCRSPKAPSRRRWSRGRITRPAPAFRRTGVPSRTCPARPARSKSTCGRSKAAASGFAFPRREAACPAGAGMGRSSSTSHRTAISWPLPFDRGRDRSPATRRCSSVSKGKCGTTTSMPPASVSWSTSRRSSALRSA